MKKKFLSLLFALTLFVGGGVLLTACGEGPTLNDLSIFLNDVEYSQWDNYIGDFEYGDTNNLNYEVRAHFDDGSQKVLQSTDYIVTYKLNDEEISSLPQTFNEIGFYSIQIEYQGMVRKLNFDVNPARGNYETVVENNKRVWTYRQTQPDISITDESIAFDENVNPKRYIEKDQVVNPNAITSSEAANALPYQSGNQGDNSIIPGSYYLFVVVPPHGNYAESYSSLIEVTVNKATLTAEVDGKATYNYDSSYPVIGKVKLGEAITRPTVLFKDVNNEEVQIVNYDWENPEQEIDYLNNTDKVKIACVFEDKPEDDWSEYYNLPENVEVELEVTKGSLEKANVFWWTANADKELILYLGEDNGSVGETEYTRWNAYKVMLGDNEIEINGNNTKITLTPPTESGTYTYTISLRDKVNYTWADGTTADITCVVTVD